MLRNARGNQVKDYEPAHEDQEMVYKKLPYNHMLCADSI